MKHQPSPTPLTIEVTHSKQLGVSPKKGVRKTVKNVLRSTVDLASMQSREELIRCRAYSLYEARQRTNGSEMVDWLQAETEIDQMPTQQPI